MSKNKIWFVTGASKGLGLALVKQLLKNGNQVAATSRTVDNLTRAVTDDTKRFLPLAVDLTNEASVQKAIEQTIGAFGKIDVIVNNAGYGLGGSIEELTDHEIRQNFDVNVFGTLNVIRNVMPYLRKQKSGHIFNIASISGYMGNSGFGSYSATKSAVIGLSEALADEVKPFGIKVTMVAPGFFRTNFLSSSSAMYGKNQIEDYKAIHEMKGFLENEIDGKQAGNPEKAALAMIGIASEANPPVHLLLGPDAYQLVSEKLVTLQREFDEWKEITYSTNFEN
ncbi:oxidoreductase [Bacillus sp. 3103sda1]|uniref:oxidoreductase n=1 Tax=Bacillus sp. 3103sda1 TaxID=2953808 RepID=UPI00209E1A26|nr:oxidoreductase [Bacillus sp. 3103sda1]MCP1123471.1 oxidoreductase [Bacillus sp. 3103sda1]